MTDPEASVPKSPLLEVPSKLYPTGVLEADVGLDEPGEYAVLVNFDKGAGHGQGQVRIPLRVAQTGWLPTMHRPPDRRAPPRGVGCSLAGLSPFGKIEIRTPRGHYHVHLAVRSATLFGFSSTRSSLRVMCASTGTMVVTREAS